MFDKATEQYRTLLARYQRGELDPTAFGQAVSALQVTDEAGAAWQINAQDGSWLKWSGSAWIPSNPPTESKNKSLGSEVVASVKASAKSILSQLPKMILSQFLTRLPVAGLTCLSVWAIHSILLVWKNQGFNFQEPWGPYINSLGGTASAGSSAVIWGVPLALIWSTIFSLLRNGPTATFKSLAAGPSRLLSVPRSGNNGLAGFIIGAGSGLFIGSFFGLNAQAGFLLSFSSVFLIAGYPGMLLSRVINDLWTNVFKPRTPAIVGRIQEVLNSAMTGLSAGFLLLWLLPNSWELIAGLAIIGVGVYLLVAKSSATPSTPATPASSFPQGAAMSLFAWIFASAATAVFFDWLFGASVYADDGGSNEIRGGDGTDAINWTNVLAWWNSEGSGRAIAQGAPPAIASGLGAALIPPIAAPVGGLLIQDDVTKGETTENGETFNYACSAQTNGDRLIPADGRTVRQFYTICETNNPKWTNVQMTATANFSFTAPTGFTLQATNQYIAGSGSFLHAEVICIPPADAAYAPGRIPGVVYASASSPLGSVNGHCAIEIEVGGGEMILHPLDREWVRAPMAGQPSDSLTLFARLALPSYCVQVPDSELNQTLTLRTLGQSANYMCVNPPQDPEGWRSWIIGPNDQLQPSQFENGTTVEFGMEGRIMAGLLQKTFQMQLLPFPQVKFEPPEPFLVSKLLEEIEVVAKIKGAAPGEEWTIQDPVFSSGDQQIIVAGTVTPKPPAEAKLKFQLHGLPDNRDEASATFKVKAKLTKAVKDYNGPNETEEANLIVIARRPGLIILSKMPVALVADAAKTAKLEIAVLRYKPGEAGNPGTLMIDDVSAKPPTLKFADKAESEGVGQNAFNLASLGAEFQEFTGTGLQRRALYKITSTTPVPSHEESYPGKWELYVDGEKEETFRKKLDLSLQTISPVSKVKDLATEKRLCLEALERMFKKPYDNEIEARQKAGLIQRAIRALTDPDLEPLIKTYNANIEEINRLEGTWGAQCFWKKRKEVLESATDIWQGMAGGYTTAAKYCEAAEKFAKTVDWLAGIAFSTVVQAYITSVTLWNPFLASAAGSSAETLRQWVNKFISNAVDNKSVAETLKEIEEESQKTIRDWFTQDFVDTAVSELTGQKQFGGQKVTKEVPPKVKVALLCWFLMVRLYRNYNDPDPETQVKPTGYIRTLELTAWDIAGKKIGEKFGSFIEGMPSGATGTKISVSQYLKIRMGLMSADSLPSAHSGSPGADGGAKGPVKGDTGNTGEGAGSTKGQGKGDTGDSGESSGSTKGQGKGDTGDSGEGSGSTKGQGKGDTSDSGESSGGAKGQNKGDTGDSGEGSGSTKGQGKGDTGDSGEGSGSTKGQGKGDTGDSGESSGGAKGQGKGDTGDSGESSGGAKGQGKGDTGDSGEGSGSTKGQGKGDTGDSGEGSGSTKDQGKGESGDGQKKPTGKDSDGNEPGVKTPGGEVIKTQDDADSWVANQQKNNSNEVETITKNGKVISCTEGDHTKVGNSVSDADLKGAQETHSHPNKYDANGNLVEAGGAPSVSGDIADFGVAKGLNSVTVKGDDGATWKVEFNNDAIDQKGRKSVEIDILEAQFKNHPEVMSEVKAEANNLIRNERLQCKLEGRDYDPQYTENVKQWAAKEIKQREVNRIAEQFGNYIKVTGPTATPLP
jgi:hypothetical protein